MSSYGGYLATERTSAFQIITRPLFHLPIRFYTRFLSPSHPDHLRCPTGPGSTNCVFEKNWVAFLGRRKFSFWNIQHNKLNFGRMSNYNDSFRWFESSFSRWRHLSTGWWSVCCRKGCLCTLFISTLCLWRFRGLLQSFFHHLLKKSTFRSIRWIC